MLVPPKKSSQKKKARRVFNGGYSSEQIAKGLTIGFGFADPAVVKKYSRGITLDQAKAELKVQVKRA